MSSITNRTKNFSEYEQRTEEKAIRVTMPCSKCDGEMKFTGLVYCTNPPYNVHRCDKCGCEEEFLGVVYPGIQYRSF